VTGISFSPSVVRGLATTTMTVTLDGPAPAGGANVSISKAPNGQIVNTPGVVNIPQGDSSANTIVGTNKVSRTLSTNVTATYGGASSVATLTVTR
jgi:trimeric autotransporter adhesin